MCRPRQALLETGGFASTGTLANGISAPPPSDSFDVALLVLMRARFDIDGSSPTSRRKRLLERFAAEVAPTIFSLLEAVSSKAMYRSLWECSFQLLRSFATVAAAGRHIGFSGVICLRNLLLAVCVANTSEGEMAQADIAGILEDLRGAHAQLGGSEPSLVTDLFELAVADPIADGSSGSCEAAAEETAEFAAAALRFIATGNPAVGGSSGSEAGSAGGSSRRAAAAAEALAKITEQSTAPATPSSARQMPQQQQWHRDWKAAAIDAAELEARHVRAEAAAAALLAEEEAEKAAAEEAKRRVTAGGAAIGAGGGKGRRRRGGKRGGGGSGTPGAAAADVICEVVPAVAPGSAAQQLPTTCGPTRGGGSSAAAAGAQSATTHRPTSFLVEEEVLLTTHHRRPRLLLLRLSVFLHQLAPRLHR